MSAEPTLTVAEVRDHLKLKTSDAVIRLITSGQLAGFKLGQQWRIRPAALREYEAAAEARASGKPTSRPANVADMAARLTAAKAAR